MRAPAATRAEAHTFYGPNLKQVPRSMTRRNLPGNLLHRAPGDAGVIRQTVLLTPQNLVKPDARFPSTATDQHPAWSADERYIYFDSNRVSNTDPSAGSNFNIYRIFTDGTGVTQITTGTGDSIEPAVSPNGNRLAYVSGSGGGFSLYVQDLNTGDVVNLTNGNPSGFVFTDVRHPSWGAAGNIIAFSGKRTGETVYHIYKVDTDQKTITELTAGPSNDYSPAWSPDGNLIAFTSNANAFAAGTGVSTGLNADGHDDIWVVNTNPFTPNITRVTGFAVNGKNASNRNPAWSSTTADPLGIIPRGPGQNGGIQMLAFASTRADTDPNQPGVPTDVVATTDIYWLQTPIVPDTSGAPGTGGTFVIATPESPGNLAHKLITSTPDTAINSPAPPPGTPGDPAFMFDPNFSSNEDYPTWPQFKNSYRIAFQSDRGGNLNIWASTIFDINAPTLIKYDLANNEIVHVGRASAPDISVREVAAGERVRFRVRVSDYESGVAAVYLQIKDPNSQPQSADGLEHKVYTVGSGIFDGNPTSPTSLKIADNEPYEIDSQAINTKSLGPNDRWRDPGFGGLPGNWPGANLFHAGISDVNAFSGSAALQQPDDFWLRVYDDGPVSKGGNEPEGETAGDGVYSAEWTTPSDLPSDWYIDVIAFDRAVDPFDTTITTNWKIYDNVWGFTTQPFKAVSQLLYVNDYDCGQSFFTTHFGSGTTFVLPFYNGVPTESWMTEIDPGMLPTTYTTNGKTYPLLNVLNTLGISSYKDALTDDGTPIPVTGRYDQWRILSRGPVPNSVLNAYAPHLEIPTTPDPLNGGSPGTPILVAEKCIVWHSPYTGDLFVGPGTILEGDTQARLAAWVAKGGRLFVDGQDTAWALTLGGGNSTFLNGTMKVNFTQDLPNQLPANQIALVVGNPKSRHPISTEYWTPTKFVDTIHFGYGEIKPGPVDDPPSSSPLYLGDLPNIVREYGALNNAIPDVITLIPAETNDVTAVDGSYSVGGQCLTWFTDTTTHSKVVYSSFDWASINPEWYTPTGAQNIVVFKNRRTEMMHNVGDFLRTGRIVGTVRDVNGAVPLGGVFLRAISDYTGQVVSQTVSQADGTYILSGLDATGSYDLDAIKPGYLAQHVLASWFHGGYQTRIDTFLTQAQPGSISGKITTTDGVTPVAGATVQAQDEISQATFTGTSDVNGNYTIKNVPASTYDLTVINLQQIGYASSIPPIIKGVVVASNTNTANQNFQLKALPGSVTGKVDIADANGVDTGVGLPNALVTATIGTTNLPPVATDANGNYTLSGLDPGTYGIIASKAGYLSSTSIQITVVSNQSVTVPTIALKPVPPGSISGLVTRTSDGAPVPGVTITLTDTAGNVVKTGTTTTVQTVNGYTFNYLITGVPAGQTLNVSASLAGYTSTPATQGAQITSGVETKSINFSLDPLHTFSAALSLVSAPYDYTTNVGDLLGIPASDRSTSFLFATFDPTAVKYVSYPTPPADTFHIGRGYFLSYSSNMALTTQGTAQNPAPGVPTRIALQPGWNLIGDPYPFSIDYLNAKIETANGAQVDVGTAQSQGLIGNALWTYQYPSYQLAFTLDPWQGYWVRAFQAVTLVVDPAQKITRSVRPGTGTSGTSRSSRAPIFDNATGSGWKVSLVARSGQNYATPAMIGVHRAATNSFDPYKVETPPTIGNQNVTLTFDHKDWADKSGHYSVDLRSAADTSQQWDFTVTSNILNAPVTLSWPDIATVPGRQDLILVDVDSNTRSNMRSRGGYTIPASATALTRHFRIEMRRATRRKLDLVDVTARVNNSRATNAPASVGITYRLTTDAQVQISILQNGRRIRTVEPGSDRAAGTATTVWDMKNDQGVGVASNLYTIEVRATDSDGTVVRKTTPLLITR